MKLFVTIGTTPFPLMGEIVDFIEKEFDIPDGEYATYIGLEIEHKEGTHYTDEHIGPRQTILRTPFHQHGKTSIHTVCSLPEETVKEVELK